MRTIAPILHVKFRQELKANLGKINKGELSSMPKIGMFAIRVKLYFDLFGPSSLQN